MKTISEELYLAAVPLHQALIKYGNANDAREYNQLLQSISQDHSALITNLIELTFSGEINDSDSGAIKRNEQRQAIHKRLSQQLMEQITNGTLVAYGYSIPRKIDDEPQRIPSNLFHLHFTKWDKSSINVQGLKIEEIRILPAEQLKLLSEADKEDILTPQTQIGRPSSKEAIQNAYLALIEANAIDFSQALTYNIREIIQPYLENKYGTLTASSNRFNVKRRLAWLTRARIS